MLPEAKGPGVESGCLLGTGTRDRDGAMKEMILPHQLSPLRVLITGRPWLLGKRVLGKKEHLQGH